MCKLFIVHKTCYKFIKSIYAFRQKKIFLTAICVIFSTLTIVNGAVEGTTLKVVINNPIIKINGHAKPPLKIAPFIENNRTMINMPNELGEVFYTIISWDVKQKKVGIKSPDLETYIELQVDSHVAKINGNDVPIDTSIVIKDNRICIPLRFVMETFGGVVTWDETLRQVTVNRDVVNRERSR